MSFSTPEAKALALFQAGRLAEAESALRAILAHRPDDADALHILGCVVAQAGRREEGLRLLDQSIERAPRNADFFNNRARVLNEVGRTQDAVRDLRHAVQLEPSFTAAHYALGSLFLEMGELTRAGESFRKVLEREPRHAPALNDFGVILHHAGRLDEAIAHYATAVDARPDFARALLNWGNALRDGGDLEGARALYERALLSEPDFPEALNNAAGIAVDLGRPEEARRYYERALQRRPDFADARFGLAQLDLREQRFEEGWKGYETRFETSPPQATRKTFFKPSPGGAGPVRGQRVALWSEQGVGDQILFSTLLPDLADLGVAAVVEIDPRLAGIYRRSLPAFEFTVPQKAEQAFESCAVAMALGSLPRWLRPSVASFARQPRALLKPDPERVARMRERLGPGRWFAISWRSFQPGRGALAERKSIPLENFARLAESTGARLLDLQYGDVSAEREAFEARHPGLLLRLADLDARDDFDAMLAAMAACERVVTASNVTAHLGGSIGKATTVVFLKAWPPFHYWGCGPGGRSLWYPSVEIASEASWTTWEAAFGALSARLS